MLIFEGDDQTNATLIRACCKNLGTELPVEWSAEQVVQFFNTVSNDNPRVYTDAEKADMKFSAM